LGKYLRTIRDEIRTPQLGSRSTAIRSSSYSTFSRAILQISSRSSIGIGDRPARDFIRQNNFPAGTVPADHRRRLQDHQCVTPTKEPCQ
jgi:hypothetical protein